MTLITLDFLNTREPMGRFTYAAFATENCVPAILENRVNHANDFVLAPREKRLIVNTDVRAAPRQPGTPDPSPFRERAAWLTGRKERAGPTS
jgi:hypothetical protein